jgi:hypothetical protein
VTNRVIEIIARRKSGAVVARWPLAPGEYTLGASSGSDLRLETPGVSRKHARIVVREGEVLIEDLGSRFGTRRGGKLLEGPVPFTVNSPVEIGDVRLEAEPLIARPPFNLPVATRVGQSAVPPPAEKSQSPAPASADERPQNEPPIERKSPPTLGWKVALFAVLIAAGAFGFLLLQRVRLAEEAAALQRTRADGEHQRAEAAQTALDSLLAQQRPADAAALGGTPEDPDNALSAQLESLRRLPGWNSSRLRRLSPKAYALDLSELEVRDLSALRGLPITDLSLAQCDLSALPDLGGLALRRLVLTGTRIADLLPLRGQPIEELIIDQTRVADLTPLAGLPLQELSLRETPVRDIAPLGGLPLRALDLRDHSGILDYRPLLACRQLESLYAPVDADLYCLREHPALKLLAIRTPQMPRPGAVDGPFPVSAFWLKYGDMMKQRAKSSEVRAPEPAAPARPAQ